MNIWCSHTVCKLLVKGYRVTGCSPKIHHNWSINLKVTFSFNKKHISITCTLCFFTIKTSKDELDEKRVRKVQVLLVDLVPIWSMTEVNNWYHLEDSLWTLNSWTGSPVRTKKITLTLITPVNWLNKYRFYFWH